MGIRYNQGNCESGKTIYIIMLENFIFPWICDCINGSKLNGMKNLFCLVYQ